MKTKQMELKEVTKTAETPQPVIERKTAIEKSNLPKTVKWIVKNKDRLRFDLAIQRNSVWKSEQKSLFIHSLMYGFPFPPAYAQHSTDGQLWLLDGKQRLTTLIDFVEGKFSLHSSTPDVFGFSVAELYFEELPEQFRDEILDTYFTIHEMKNMTEAERDEMFYRLNNGSALSKLEVTRSMYSELFSEVGEVAELTFFSEVVHLTNSAKNRFVDQELVLQIAMLLDEDHKLKGFGGNQVRDYVMSLKEKGEGFSSEVRATFEEISEYLAVAFEDYNKKERGKVLKKINVPMVFMQGKIAKEEGMSPKQFAKFCKWFLIELYDIDSKYGVSCQAGSAKRENVIIRLKEIDSAYQRFIKRNPIENYKPEEVEEEKPKEVVDNVVELKQKEEVTTV